MFVVLCHGEEHGADLLVYGPFPSEEKAYEWIAQIEAAVSCPNEHEVQRVLHV